MAGESDQPSTTLATLLDALAALPPVAQGKVRVYRGQTADYDNIAPAAFRKPLPSRGVLATYSWVLLRGVARGAGVRQLFMEELLTQTLWLEALAQHYGSGSSYLDVTHSIESAAWFALHVGSWLSDGQVPGLDRPAETAALMQGFQWFCYAPATQAGFLYAFDVDLWNPADGIPPDLTLVDLSKAPEALRTARMLAQHGGLLRTAALDEHDLRRRRVPGTPLRVAWPMTGSDFVNRPVSVMFPGPREDAWFRRYLGAPMVLDVTADGLRTEVRRPLPITLYAGESAAYNRSIADCEVLRMPPLLHWASREGTLSSPPPGDADRDRLMRGATPLVLEMPLLHSLPADIDRLWNHALLVEDQVDVVACYAADSQPIGHVRLDNVLIQFSPLEDAFWESTGPEGAVDAWIRGIWMIRAAGELIVAAVVQQPGTDVATVRPSVRVRFDRGTRRLICRSPVASAALWCKLSAVPELALPVVVALHVLRALNPDLKVDAGAFKWAVADAPGAAAPGAAGPGAAGPGVAGPGVAAKVNIYSPSVYADAARLVRARCPTPDLDWFFVRSPTGDPFAQAPSQGPGLTITSSVSYADIDPRILRDALERHRTSPPPA